MSLPTNGGTGRGALASVSALPALSCASLPRPQPPSYSISRSQIVAHGLTRKRSHSGESPPLPPIRSSRIAFTPPHVSSSSPPSTSSQSPRVGSTASGSVPIAALRSQLPVPPAAKRLRREPLSPTSVREVSDAKKMPPAKSATATTPGSAQMLSMLRGLQHVATCSASGCPNPLCVSTRTFVEKVKAHRSAMTGKAGHDANRCGACKLWGAIVRAHAPMCSAGTMCRVPGCSPQP